MANPTGKNARNAKFCRAGHVQLDKRHSLDVTVLKLRRTGGLEKVVARLVGAWS